ncbi:hypothetical protein IQ232_19630 [Microcystis aeruginosa LEGE 11464]|jgi:hypothetical protein|uniref:hypothetical protein n=1 Tax=Microcystis TaxID=1125 RepID=UPI00187E6754|nr:MULTISPECIES: hypothetical protein [Microcystis]MBE9091855.1 hypothetical protein [Microcystis aeruginosa LEGE 11464]MCA2658147.1 hypothetical protein [Microcystis sp. M049S2]MCZ8125675.1 hypothetical protein [Microcystis sp. LE19-114.1B]
MNYHPPSQPLPAPCIIDSGVVIAKEDMRRLLDDIGRVRYIHSLEGVIQSEGEGWIVEVFADYQQSTLVANCSLYLNTYSFDYLRLTRSPEGETYFDLIQDNRQLRLIPLSNPLQDPDMKARLNADTLEAMVTQVLSAKWDVQFEDEDDNDCPF